MTLSQRQNVVFLKELLPTAFKIHFIAMLFCKVDKTKGIVVKGSQDCGRRIRSKVQAQKI